MLEFYQPVFVPLLVLDLLKWPKLAMLALRRHQKVSGVVLDWSLSEQPLGRAGRNTICTHRNLGFSQLIPQRV